MVAAGALGELRVVQVEYPQDWLTDAARATGQQAGRLAHRSRSARAPAARIGDIGTHAYNLARFVTGLQDRRGQRRPAAPSCRAASSTTTSTSCCASRAARAACSGQPGRARQRERAALRVYGSKAGLEWAQEHPNQLWFTPLGKPPQLLTRGGAGCRRRGGARHPHPGRPPRGLSRRLRPALPRRRRADPGALGAARARPAGLLGADRRGRRARHEVHRGRGRVESSRRPLGRRATVAVAAASGMDIGIDIGTSEVKVAAARRRRSASSATAHAAAAGVAAAAAVVGAGSARLVDAPRSLRSPSCARRSRRVLAAVRGIGLSGQMHGATLLDARRPGAAPGDPVERRPQRRECAELERRVPALPPHHRQHRDAGLHRAQAAVGARARARDLRRGRHGAAAQGLRAAAAHRRARLRDVRRRRHAVARRRQRALVGRAARRHRPDATHMPRLVEGSAAPAARCAPSSRATGASTAAAVVAGGAGDNAASAVGIGVVGAGHGLPVARHLGRAFVANDALLARTRARRCTPSATAFPEPGTRWA